MPPRSNAAEILRELNSLSAPLCVFDADRRLIFANQACCDWVGVPIEQLAGRKANFSSAASADDPALDRLCPPPDAFAGRSCSGLVFALSAQGQLRQRRADFLPLDFASADLPVPVLVRCSADDVIAADADAGDADSIGEPRWSNCDQPNDSLHARLMRLRQSLSSQYSLDRFVGDSQAVRLARSQATAAIISRANVTVVGPKGTERELLVRTIHYAAHDNGQNASRDPEAAVLITINGALLTREVLESATSAIASPGRLATATVLVLNLESLPLDLQADLVRVFVQRFSGIRLLATGVASPNDLEAQGRLRPELAAALSTLVIHLPPLASRREDIPLLAQLCLEERNAEGGKQLARFNDQAMDALVAYSWPGNVAELRAFVDEAFRRAVGHEIAQGDLPPRIAYAGAAARRPVRKEETIVLTEFLTSIERELVDRALKQSKGNKTKAARLLGLTRPRLYRRMVQLGLEAPPIDAVGERSRIAPVRAAADRIRHQGTVDNDPPRNDAPDGGTDAPDDSTEFIEDIPFEEQPE